MFRVFLWRYGGKEIKLQQRVRQEYTAEFYFTFTVSFLRREALHLHSHSNIVSIQICIS